MSAGVDDNLVPYTVSDFLTPDFGSIGRIDPFERAGNTGPNFRRPDVTVAITTDSERFDGVIGASNVIYLPALCVV